MTIQQLIKRKTEIETIMNVENCADATAHPLWNEYENLLGILAGKEILKNELLKRYKEVVTYGHPALRNATPDKQLKMYPMMQFIREMCL